MTVYVLYDQRTDREHVTDCREKLHGAIAEINSYDPIEYRVSVSRAYIMTCNWSSSSLTDVEELPEDGEDYFEDTVGGISTNKCSVSIARTIVTNPALVTELLTLFGLQDYVRVSVFYDNKVTLSVTHKVHPAYLIAVLTLMLILSERPNKEISLREFVADIPNLIVLNRNIEPYYYSDTRVAALVLLDFVYNNTDGLLQLMKIYTNIFGYRQLYNGLASTGYGREIIDDFISKYGDFLTRSEAEFDD